MSEHESEQDLLREDDYDYVPGGRRRRGRGAKGCIAVIVALAVLVGGFYFGLTKGVSWVADQFQGPEDYPGPGTGSIEFTVNEGDVVAQIGRNLKADGVTASVQAFIDACTEDCTGIQVGAYELQKEMKAADVREVLRKAAASQAKAFRLVEGEDDVFEEGDVEGGDAPESTLDVEDGADGPAPGPPPLRPRSRLPELPPARQARTGAQGRARGAGHRPPGAAAYHRVGDRARPWRTRSSSSGP